MPHLSLPQILICLGVGVSLLANLAYIRDMIHSTTRPNRVTFLLWGLAPLIAALVAVEKGETWTTVPVFLSAAVCFLVLGASFLVRGAYWKLEPFDYLCGALSLMALIEWRVTEHPDLATLLAVISDALATLPTLRKAWRAPRSESALAYVASAFNASLGLWMIQVWDFTTYAFPVYLLVTTAALSAIILVRRNLKNRASV